MRVAHLRFIERISQLFGEIQSSQDIIPTDNEINHRRGKRSIVAASLGAIATSAIWYFVDNVRNVNSNLNQINKDIEAMKNIQQDMMASIKTLAKANIENQLQIEADFGINGISKMMNGGLHPEFISIAEILETFSNRYFIFESLIYKKHPSSIFSFAEVAVERWDTTLEEASLKVCLPAIKEQQLYVSTTIINIGFFVEHEFARYNTPELSVTVNGTEYAYSLKNCTMKVKLIVTTLIINFTRIIGFISFMSLS
uniref:Uncharacterized protein n=1 Tax=Panagrolaimus superbus TaxID=310955 RepID=A0A914Y0A2_9BILA